MDLRSLNGKKVEIKLVKSLIGTLPNQRKTANALGLRKTGSTRVHSVNSVFIGMYEKVRHLLQIRIAE